jgi:hypothetical protein
VSPINLSAYTHGIKLSSGDSPTTITNTARITGSAVKDSGGYRDADTAWVLTNKGYINEPSLGSFGIQFVGSGTITHQTDDTISGYFGVRVQSGLGNVVNVGAIAGNANYANNDGSSGFYLQNGGTVINGASSGMASPATILGYNDAGLLGASGTDTLINYGTLKRQPQPPGGRHDHRQHRQLAVHVHD